MIRILILLFPILLFSNVTFAAECDDVLLSVKTMRDARKYFRCVAEQTPNGAIFSWDAVIRDKDGAPTGEYRSVPDDWQVCNGENRTPDLTGRFLMGAASLSGAGETGGKANIKESGVHTHSGTTGVTRGPDHGISCSGKCSGAVQQLTAILLILVNLESIPTVPICLHITKSFTFAKLAIFLSEYRPTI